MSSLYNTLGENNISLNKQRNILIHHQIDNSFNIAPKHNNWTGDLNREQCSKEAINQYKIPINKEIMKKTLAATALITIKILRQ